MKIGRNIVSTMQQFSGICIYLECSIDIKYLAISHTGFVTIIYYLSYCFLSYGFWLIIVIPLQQVLHYYISFFLCIQRYSRPAPIYELFMMSFWTLYQRFSLYVKLLRLLMANYLLFIVVSLGLVSKEYHNLLCRSSIKLRVSLYLLTQT